MQAEFKLISPTSILANALDITANELARLKRAAASGELTLKDAKKYQIFINALTKLSSESREQEKQSYLRGKTDEEIQQLVQQALDALDPE